MKIELHKNKSIKLVNVLYTYIEENNISYYDLEVEKMINYLNIKGMKNIGPLIQYTKVNLNQNEGVNMEIKILLQSNNYIYNVESPYHMESVICVKNCIYVRYQGDENKLKFAYDKINLTAFEEDIPLKGDSYTIFVEQKDDQIIADVFMERAD